MRILTLSATYGARGSVIGPQLAERLGLPFADRLIPAHETTATEPGGESLTEEERHQSSRQRILNRLALVTGGMGMPVPTGADIADPVRVQVERSIQDLLAGGGAVILGRAGAVVLAGDPRAYHVRLDGPTDRRTKLAMRLEGIDEGTARDRLDETDRARARYVERLYGRDAADPSLYHLVVDTTVLAPEDCVTLVATAASMFWRQAAGPG